VSSSIRSAPPFKCARARAAAQRQRTPALLHWSTYIVHHILAFAFRCVHCRDRGTSAPGLEAADFAHAPVISRSSRTERTATPCAMSAVARTPRPVAAKSKSSIGGAANSDEQRIVRSARGRHRRRPEPPYNKEQWGLPRAGDPHSLTGSAEDPFEQSAGRRGSGTVRRMSTAQIASAAVHTDRRAFTASSSGSADPTESCAARCCGEPRCGEPLRNRKAAARLGRGHSRGADGTRSTGGGGLLAAPGIPDRPAGSGG
jgi:hypothetical protein